MVRLFRRLKEQAIDGRVFPPIEEVRDAVRNFAARYSAAQRIEKNGDLSPIDTCTRLLDTSLRQATSYTHVSRNRVRCIDTIRQQLCDAASQIQGGDP